MTLDRCVRLVCLVAAALSAMGASPDPAMADANVANFGIFGLASGERARLNVVNVSTGTPCSVELEFFDGAGNALPPRQEVLAPGGSASLLVAQSSSRERRRFRAQVTDLGDSGALGSICIATLELFTKDRTVALLQQ